MFAPATDNIYSIQFDMIFRRQRIFWNDNMNYKHLKKDSSGISVLIVLVIAAVVIIAGAATYVLISDDDTVKEYGVGTTYSYDVTGDYAGNPVNGTNVLTIIGQSDKEYFIESVTELRIGAIPIASGVEYNVSSKTGETPAGAIKIGSEKITTIDGEVKVDVWEYSTEDVTGEPVHAKIYVDPKTSIEYRSETTYEGQLLHLVANLSSMKELDSTPYEESRFIGDNYVYLISTIEEKYFKVEMECVADCIDGKYGMAQKLTTGDKTVILYFLATTPQGLMDGALDSKLKETFMTIDGEKECEIWLYTESSEHKVAYGVDGDSGIIYLIEDHYDGVSPILLVLDRY